MYISCSGSGIDMQVRTLEKEARCYEKRIAFFSDFAKNRKVKTVLFLGCGLGYESFCYGRKCPTVLTVGIDLHHRKLDKNVRKYVNFIVCDGAHLPFTNNAFDWEYCSHVLEHVPENTRVPFVQEMRRTVKRGALVACPNANRLLSPFNAVEEVAIFQIVKRNLADWFHRLKGDFQNYHRGFTEDELTTLLCRFFQGVYCTTVEYDFYVTQGTRYKVFIKILNKIGLLRIAGPAHTFICES
jgi:ubiquinone/menaquinone biosynthesis C-methylase UbiE